MLRNNPFADELRAYASPAYYARSRLDFTPDAWQNEFLDSWEARQLLLCSRQSGKTTSAAIKATHVAKYFAGSLSLILSPTLRQSSEVFRNVLSFVQADETMVERVEENKLNLTMVHGSRIVSLPSKEGTVRGYAAPRLIIEDEASQVADELYYAIRPMLAVGGGMLLLLSTPRGRRGHFYNAYSRRKKSWKLFEVTADMCPRISRDFLEEEKDELPEEWFRQEYYCEFLEVMGQVFSMDEIASVFDGKPQVDFFSAWEEVNDYLLEHESSITDEAREARGEPTIRKKLVTAHGDFFK